MCIGNVIRFARNYQDFRYMGGFAKYLPFEASMTLVGLINLGGLPFSFGFFIKHYTLVSLFDINNIFIKISLFLGMLSSLIYSYRLYYYIFFDTKKAKKTIYLAASKSILKSKFYSNSTLASAIAITLLLLFSCFIILYIYFSFLGKVDSENIYSIGSINNKALYIIQTPIKNIDTLATFIN